MRGYRDGQFVGKHFWRGNIEYRVPSWISRNLVLQHVAFFDIGNTGNTYSRIFKNETFNSLGVGLRIISPRVFRLNVRIDYARTFGRTTGGAFSFGLQQFF